MGESKNVMMDWAYVGTLVRTKWINSHYISLIEFSTESEDAFWRTCCGASERSPCKPTLSVFCFHCGIQFIYKYVLCSYFIFWKPVLLECLGITLIKITQTHSELTSCCLMLPCPADIRASSLKTDCSLYFTFMSHILLGGAGLCQMLQERWAWLFIFINTQK